MLAGAGVAALAPVGASALAPLQAAAANILVAVVIDFGGGSGAPADVVQCVTVPSGSTDAQALAVVDQQTSAFANSGLLCSIDGYPPNGVSDCDASSGDDYYYWSYWHGSTGSWVYANDGPAEQVVAAGDVEGWRFEDPGPASPAAAKPGPSPDYETICPQAATAATTTTAAPTTTTTAAPTAGAGSAPPTTAPPSAATPTTAPATVGGGGSSTSSSAPAPGGTGSTTAPAAGSGSGGRTSTQPRSDTSDDPSIRGPTGTTSVPGRRARAIGPTGHRRGAGGGAPWPLIVTGALVVVLGTASVLRWRRRERAA
jgi:hypothetical protein